MLSSNLRTALLLTVAMICAAIGAVVARPAPISRGAGSAFQLEQIVPLAFGSWKVVPQPSLQLINPQTQELLDKLYSQLLTRVYVNDKGYRIMLSMAYGDDQRGGLQAHMPEVCYPAQGFTLLSRERADVPAVSGTIPVQRLNTRLGARQEPITYWFSFGNHAMAGNDRWQMRLIEFRFGLSGQVPNGLLVRVSSIDAEAPAAYLQHDRFIQDLLESLSPADRLLISGIADVRASR
jgi:EpsI family protein